MKLLACAVLFLALCSLASAQSFTADKDAFVLRRGKEFIRFEKGRWSAGIEGGRSVSWHAFLWHDEWKYETMPGGKVEAGPALRPDGSLTMSGLFSVSNPCAPVKYAVRMTPGAEGLKVHCEFEKTGEVKLSSGIWLHLFAEGGGFTGHERVWADPSWHGTVNSAGDGSAERFLIELQGSRALCLTPGGFRSMNREGSNGIVYRLNILPEDFKVGEKAVAEYAISFADMPAEFPGEVKPMKEPLAIRAVTANAASVARYGKVELSVDLGATYDNPYDPGEVVLDAVFTAPSGKQIAVPGFFMVEEKRVVRDGHEVLIPQGHGVWKVRFAPAEVGKYAWRLTLKDRSGQVAGGEGGFEATAGAAKGFVRQSKADPHSLQFDNGDGYFAIGHNLPGYHTSGQLGDEAMRKFAANKENYNRWWMSSGSLGIEWMDKLGWYRQDAAARIDLLLDVAQDLGMYYMLCMDTHQDFREGGWERNPFNAKNGGPCAKPADWFTNETARKLYKQRLRYTVARWGYSPNILCWEFGNEFEGWADSPDSIKLPWHREMSDTLHGLDPFGHLITTSFWGHTGPPEYWALPNIGIVQTHLYTNGEESVAEAVHDMSLKQWRGFAKPHIFGEFGIDSRGGFEKRDPEGWGIHNALWAGLTSFCAGGPMPWWHENYIEPLNLYFHFTAIANFVAGLPLGTAKWEPLETGAPEFLDKNRKPQTRDIKLIPLSRWGKPEANEFVVQADGSLQGEFRPQQLLQGDGHKDIKNEPTFVVNYPQAGEFSFHVGTVSNSGLVRVWVDDVLKLQLDLPCAEGLEKKSVYREQWKLWETTYEVDYSVGVPAGRHRIRVENFGKDWVTVGSYTFTGCKVLDKPNVLVCGMKSGERAILWLQNRDSDWFNHLDKAKVGKVDAFALPLAGLADGKYEAQWWETWKGSVARTEAVEVKGGKVTLGVPDLATDVAVKLRRL